MGHDWCSICGESSERRICLSQLRSLNVILILALILMGCDNNKHNSSVTGKGRKQDEIRFLQVVESHNDRQDLQHNYYESENEQASKTTEPDLLTDS